MSNPLPLLLAGGAALLLVGGKKKKTKSAPAEEAPNQELPEEEMDEGEGPDPDPSVGEGPGYGTVASGLRKDRLGNHPWRIKYDADGYHAQLLVTNTRFSPVQGEVGTAASARAAKSLLRDYYNELLLEKFPDEEPKNDPPDFLRMKSDLAYMGG